MTDTWQLNPLVMLNWRQIDGEWLVHEDLSGATHMIGHLGAAVLTCLEDRVPLTMTDLLAQLRTDLDLDVAPDAAAAVLRDIQALGLLLTPGQGAALHAAG